MKNKYKSDLKNYKKNHRESEEEERYGKKKPYTVDDGRDFEYEKVYRPVKHEEFPDGGGF